MTHFHSCKCTAPTPNASGVVCSICNGFIKKSIREESKTNDPVKETFQWHMEDPEEAKLVRSLAETLMSVENGEELYAKNHLFHKIIGMIVFHKADPIQMIADLTVRFAEFQKNMEDYMKTDNRPILIKTDEVQTK